jgi:hypothetical protein
VAVIKVGAATEVEMKEKKARVEDALHATRAAVEEGIVPGGGVALVRTFGAIGGLTGANHDQGVGIAIARRAMEEPLRQIVANANAGAEASVVMQKVAEGEGNSGCNAGRRASRRCATGGSRRPRTLGWQRTKKRPRRRATGPFGAAAGAAAGARRITAWPERPGRRPGQRSAAGWPGRRPAGTPWRGRSGPG